MSCQPKCQETALSRSATFDPVAPRSPKITSKPITNFPVSLFLALFVLVAVPVLVRSLFGNYTASKFHPRHVPLEIASLEERVQPEVIR